MRKPLLLIVACLVACAPAMAGPSKKSGAAGTITSTTMNHSGISTGGGTTGTLSGPILPFATPTLTRTSTSGTNPPTWDAVMPDLEDGDTIQLDFTSNGSAPDGTAEESHTAEATETSIAWSTFTGFAGGSTVKWTERYGRTISGTPVWSNWAAVLSDTMTAGALWVEETPPAGQNIAFGSNSATFPSIHFGIGMGVVITATSDRLISGVTVNGVSATLVSQSSSGTKGVAFWTINETAAGSYSVVLSAASALKHVAIVTGTMTPTSQTASSIATPKAYAYTSDPQALASITVPTNGIALCALTSETVTPGITWASPATQETNVVEGTNSDGVRLTTAKMTSTGACSLTGLSGGGTAMVAAAWAP